MLVGEGRGENNKTTIKLRAEVWKRLIRTWTRMYQNLARDPSARKRLGRREEQTPVEFVKVIFQEGIRRERRRDGKV